MAVLAHTHCSHRQQFAVQVGCCDRLLCVKYDIAVSYWFTIDIDYRESVRFLESKLPNDLLSEA
jgi:hypothetical protein